MSDSERPAEDFAPLSRDELQSALFAQMVLQHSNMARLLLGKVPDPHTGQTMRDLEAARLFIDQLEMLEVKTKGNLSRDEETFLKQSLMNLRLAYVEAVESSSPAPKPAEPDAAPEAAPQATDAAAQTKTPSAEPAGGEESRKRYSKKFTL